MAPARTIVIGGGSGFVGTHLCKLLKTLGYNVSIISRMPGPNRMTWHDLTKCGLPENTKAVVNLAGQNILDMKQRWTSGFKQNVWNSRVNTTCLLANAIGKAECLPESFIVMTGVGIYPPDPLKCYDETSCVEPNDYITDLCHNWEKASVLPDNLNVRRVVVRSGVVLGRRGGMIQNIILPFYFGLGGPLGSGRQVLPWIHIEDTCRLIIFAIENEKVDGILNGVSPHIITNAEFTQAFAQALRRPAFFRVPEKVLNVLLSEERAQIVTKGQRVIPERTESLGFTYKYRCINDACKEFAHL